MESASVEPPGRLFSRDFGGGGVYLAFGVVCALLEAGRSGRGQVVDAAMVDGAASLATAIFGLRGAGLWSDTRGENVLDSGAPWYDVYETRDGRHVAIGSIEGKFYRELLRLTGLEGEALPAQHDRARWPELRARLARAFREKTRDEWCAVMEGSDVCFAPVLSMVEPSGRSFPGSPKSMRLLPLTLTLSLALALAVAPSAAREAAAAHAYAIPANGVIGVEDAQLDAGYWIARLPDADRVVHVQRLQQRRLVAAEVGPAVEAGAATAAVAALVDRDHGVRGQLVDHLVPNPAVEAGGVHQPERGRAAAQVGAPLVARERQAAQVEMVQLRLVPHARICRQRRAANRASCSP